MNFPVSIAGAPATIVVCLLLLFTLRRALLLAAAALPVARSTVSHAFRVTAIAAVRDEEGNLPDLLAALDTLRYPADRIRFILVNDGSSDGAGDILEAWAAARPRSRVIHLPRSIGKAAALNHGLAAASDSDLVAVYDADLRPRPDSLERLVSLFQDARTGAAAGYRRPSNESKNVIAAYSALESMVHQLVTQAGKDKLRMNPTTLGGNCVYRRSALQAIGGFPANSFSEDIEVSLALGARSWRTRFLAGAVADGAMPETLPHYWNQRARWTRGLYRATRRARNPEAWLVCAGYLDRIVALAAASLAAAGMLSPVWIAVYLLAPAAAVCVALIRAKAGLKTWAILAVSAAPMFAIDLAATLAAGLNALLRRRLPWHTGRKAASP